MYGSFAVRPMAVEVDVAVDMAVAVSNTSSVTSAPSLPIIMDANALAQLATAVPDGWAPVNHDPLTLVACKKKNTGTYILRAYIQA